MKKNIFFVTSGALLMSASVFGKWTWYFSFFALIPLLYLTLNSKSYKENIIYSLIHGIIFYGISLYWLWDFEWLAYLAVVIYQTLYLLLFGILAKLFVFKSYKNQTVGFFVQVIGISLLWTICDFIRTYGIFKFSWYGIYHFQAYNSLLIQYVSFFGPYILDFFVVSFNMCLIVLLMKKRGHNIRVFEEFFATCGIVIFILLHIFNLSAVKSPISTDYKVSLLQGSVNMWLAKDTGITMETYEKLLKEVKNTNLIIMPETCFSYMNKNHINLNNNVTKKLSDIIKEKNTPLIVGANTPSDTENLYNSAVLFDEKGNWINQQNKINLVPYGEYAPAIIPYKTKSMRDIDAKKGEKITNLKINDFKINCAICYDSDFPEFFLKGKCNLLCVISNDWWFGESFAPENHLMMSVLRAVENGKYLLRCGYNGISCVISPKGEILQRTELNEKCVLNSSFGLEEKETVYHRYGKYYPYIYFVLLLGIFIWKTVYERISEKI